MIIIATGRICLLCLFVACLTLNLAVKAQIPTNNAPTTTNAIKSNISETINEQGLNILKATNCGNVEEFHLTEFYYMALLLYGTGNMRCSGSLISERYVITAAQCVLNKHQKITGVRLGELNIATTEDCQTKYGTTVCIPPAKNFGIESIIPHPSYRAGGIEYDVALLRLDRNVKFEMHISPICLPITEKSLNMQPDQIYQIAGWGITETGNLSNELMMATVTHRSNSYCQNMFPNYRILDNLICACGEDGVNACSGDFGGPIACEKPYDNSGRPRMVQYGIISTVHDDCGSIKQSYPTIYTKVESYIPWITQNIF